MAIIEILIGIRMDKINGESLLNISSLPAQAEHAIYDMFERLEKKEFFLLIQQKQMFYMIV
ncbi:T3SS effector NleH [Escherichia coli]|uniref:T3SS effector NleH n=1 Tax=Escherichia coli TaxID=562 RepID=A0A2X3JJT6_ECOLX|nr:T3SS effector NleH [Escherichia coli]